MKNCAVCQEPFDEEDQVFANDDKLYHRDCLDLIPAAYDVFTSDGKLLGTYDDPEFVCAHEHF